MLEKLHGEVFNAIHVQGMDLNPPERFFDWAVTKGVERKMIADAYNSFAVNTKVMRAQQLTAAYRLNGVPAFAINGRYVTSAYMTGGVPSTVQGAGRTHRPGAQEERQEISLLPGW
jgi:thiol:disulfide interchange protein DsbA